MLASIRSSSRLLARPFPSRSLSSGSVTPMLSLTFTCTADGCSHRSEHQFSKASYQRGVVLVQCPGCKNRHLIADHLGWFKECTDNGKLKTIEDIARAHNKPLRRGAVGEDGVIEYVEPQD